MRYTDYSILELALAIRDSKANPNAYDRESREALRKACKLCLERMPLDSLLVRFQHVSERSLAKEAHNEVVAYSKPVGYTSGLWT
jgi:hypothetical protein